MGTHLWSDHGDLHLHMLEHVKPEEIDLSMGGLCPSPGHSRQDVAFRELGSGHGTFLYIFLYLL